MQRIWIAGNAGSGKTTLANFIGERLGIPVYHRDAITWDENDRVRTEEEQISLVKNITKNEKWVFEGARFTASKADGRLDRCDVIIYLDINRFVCAYRGIKRARRQSAAKNAAADEKQPFHLGHIYYVLVEYPQKRKQREAILELARERAVRVIILKKQKDVRRFCEAVAAGRRYD